MLRYALGGIVLSTSMHSAALSLGGHSGQAVIGRALDMQVRSTASLAELESAACLEAQVSYGDTLLSPNAIAIQLRPAADGAGAVIRVRANVPINEPVVTVLLRAGCSGETFSRRYVLLADVDVAPAASATAPAALPVVPAVPTVPLATPAPAPAPAAAAPLPPVAPRVAPAPAPRTPRAAPAPAPASASTAPAAPATERAAPVPRKAPAPAPAAPRATAPTPAPAPAAAAPAPAPAARGPRLQLDPVDLTPQGAPNLKSTVELQSTPTESEERRKAAQALWAALNAPPEEQIQQAQKLATLEQEVQGLRAEEQKLKASVETLQRELQAAREAQTPGWLLGLLGGALALALGAAAWLFRERRRAGAEEPAAAPWWQSSQAVDGDGAGQALSDIAQAESGWAAPGQGNRDGDDSGVEVSEATESSFAVLHEEVPAEVDTLVDLNQHCEFFESLGQRADAMAVLEDFVGRHPSASELPYLWLLRLSDEQGRSDERLRWARRYEQVFGRVAPTPQAYDRAAPGLLEEATLLTELQRAWPTGSTQEVLRRALTAHPGKGVLRWPTLTSYQDILLLHTVAQSLPSLPQAPTAVVAAAATAAIAAPWPSAPVAAAPDVPAPIGPSPAAEPEPLDLDLTLPDVAPAPPVAEPAAPPDGPRELPMLDFDLFDLEPQPKPGEDDKKA